MLQNLLMILCLKIEGATLSFDVKRDPTILSLIMSKVLTYNLAQIPHNITYDYPAGQA